VTQDGRELQLHLHAGCRHFARIYKNLPVFPLWNQICTWDQGDFSRYQKHGDNLSGCSCMLNKPLYPHAHV
jgi:hypothetical protein